MNVGVGTVPVQRGGGESMVDSDCQRYVACL